MSSGTLRTFEVECVECGMGYESGNYDETRTFEHKHTEHTGHEVEWVKADIGNEIDLGIEWVLTCSTCDTDWHFDTEELAQEFTAEHAEYTNHDITDTPEKQSKEPPELDELAEQNALKRFIADLEDHYQSGVPVGIILALLSEGTITVADVQHELNDLKRSGDVYEPRDGHLRVVE